MKIFFYSITYFFNVRCGLSLHYGNWNVRVSQGEVDCKCKLPCAALNSSVEVLSEAAEETVFCVGHHVHVLGSMVVF